MTRVYFLCLIFALVSCQSSRSRFSPSLSGRSIANTPVLKMFIQELAQDSGRVASKELQQKVEENLIDYLRAEVGKDEAGNWVRMGITKEQAMKINSLYDDFPYMNKVQKWVMENITTLVKDVKPSSARNAYNKILGKNGSLFDPYQGMADDVQAMTTSRRNQNMPAHLREKPAAQSEPKTVEQELKSRNNRLIAAAEELEVADATGRQYLIDNLKFIDEAAKTNPMVASNVIHSMESSLLIMKKTGQRAVGKGCTDFNQKIAGEISEIKARVDMKMAELTEARAYSKAGEVFDSVDQVPMERRLTEGELDEIREEAFQDVLGYTNKEARAAIKRLKSPPCQVY